MLRAIRLENYRSFADSGRIELADLNIFIGPNSAGKTNLMSVIHLALSSAGSSFASTPLPLEGQPAFSSFDSVIRRSNKGNRPEQFALTLEWMGRQITKVAPSTLSCRRYVFSRDLESRAAIVTNIAYGTNPADRFVGQFELKRMETANEQGQYKITLPKTRSKKNIESFGFGRPFLTNFLAPRFRAGLHYYNDPIDRYVAVVRPNRPVPRSLYVLNDPGMSLEDREIITELLHIWGKNGDPQVRQGIITSLEKLGLASHMEVRPLNKHRLGPQLAEVRISPRNKKQSLTIADVGFGVSQILPLITHDASLRGGSLLVYQPEVHLHPFSQSRLADVFVDSVLRGNRLFIETHSEHLVLRLQTLVASRLIQPERVRVFCVSYDGELSQVRPMTFDERGVPTERWPPGFLDTDLTLADELVTARQRTSNPVQSPRRRSSTKK